MPRARLRGIAAAVCILGALLLAGGAGAALIEVDSIVLRADGGFQPRLLPRHRFAPIGFEGHVDIAAKGGGRPVALQQAVVGFDRDGRLSTAGLPRCPAERIANASPAEARAACRGAIVGTGHVEALISVGSETVRARSPLTIFNGSPEAGHPTVVLHAQTTVPGTQTFAIVVPIERRPGQFRYLATLNVPSIAAGQGALTHVDIAVDRRYRAGGKQRSYVSAHCSDGVLQTRGRFTFADGTVVDGSVGKFCRAR